ncbi:MAG: hypothetical protein AB7N71_01950 [Phycisphaerae bacterium]
MIGFFLTVAFLAPQVENDAGSGPQPASVQVSWQLDFEFISEPLRIDVGGQSYWYILYRVTNPEPRTHQFFPIFSIVTDDYKVVETDKGIGDTVFNAIKSRHQQVFPGLVSPLQVIGPIRTGADYARESEAIWRDVDLAATGFNVYVAGLSGESQLVPNPNFDPDEPKSKTITLPNGRTREVATNPKTFTIRKTLEIRYNIPGSLRGRGATEPIRTKTRWVLR